jgi:hypothetical protein
MDRERIYRRTKEGDKAWQTQDRDVPIEYRRMLEVIGRGVHGAVLRTSLKGYSEQHIAELLANLERLGVIESAPAGDKDDLDFTGRFKIAEIRARLEKARIAQLLNQPSAPAS